MFFNRAEIYKDLLKFLAKESKKYEKEKDFVTVDLDKCKTDLRALYRDSTMFLFLRDSILIPRVRRTEDDNIEVEDFRFKNEENLLKSMSINDLLDWLDMCMKRRNELNTDKPLSFKELTNQIMLFNKLDEEYDKIYHNFPVKWLHELCIYNRVQNLDSTFFYFIDELDQMSIHTLMNSMIRRFGLGENLQYILNLNTAPMGVVSDLKAFCNIYIKNGLPTYYDNLQDAFNDLCKGHELNKEMSPLNFAFRQYAMKVPADDNPSRPADFKKQYKEAYEKLIKED